MQQVENATQLRFPPFTQFPECVFYSRRLFTTLFPPRLFLRRGVKTSRGKVIKGEEILGRENLRLSLGFKSFSWFDRE
jgi:hypothetical protein